MSQKINPEKMKIGYIVLVTGSDTIMKYQQKMGYKESSKWTHVAGSLGGYNIIEAVMPRARVSNLQKEYIDEGKEIKVFIRKGQTEKERIKVALWWATMNNMPYDILQFIWYPFSGLFSKISIAIYNLFARNKRLVCSELIASGFYKEGDNLFDKPQSQVLPADFDNYNLFEEITDIWT